MHSECFSKVATSGDTELLYHTSANNFKWSCKHGGGSPRSDLDIDYFPELRKSVIFTPMNTDPPDSEVVGIELSGMQIPIHAGK